jgi:hypothetical protein
MFPHRLHLHLVGIGLKLFQKNQTTGREYSEETKYGQFRYASVSALGFRIAAQKMLRVVLRHFLSHHTSEENSIPFPAE